MYRKTSDLDQQKEFLRKKLIDKKQLTSETSNTYFEPVLVSKYDISKIDKRNRNEKILVGYIKDKDLKMTLSSVFINITTKQDVII